jgi:hypothetical protein
LLPVFRAPFNYKEQVMIRKLRTLLVALLLVPALSWNASAFSMENDGATLSSAESFAGYCWVYYQGRWIAVPCLGGVVILSRPRRTSLATPRCCGLR